MTALLERTDTMRTTGAATVHDLATVSLDELNATAALLTRVDRKYVLTPAKSAAFVAALPAETRVLEIDGLRRFAYGSSYLDTDRLDSFADTAHKRVRRGKVRTRTYRDSGLSFLEVKTRHRGATVKTRVPFAGTELDAAASGFVSSTLAAGGVRLDGRLRPTLHADYDRSTLLLPDAGSRVTIDTGLTWRLDSSEVGRRVDGLVIVETKSAGRASAADRILWHAGHRPTAISKYATGLAALRPDLQRNRWYRLLNSPLFD